MPGLLPSQLGRNSYVEGAHQRLTVSTAAVALTVPSDKVVVAHLQLKGGSIWYTVDGTTPSGTNGIEMIEGEQVLLNLHEALRFQAIRNSINGILTITYFRSP